MLKDEDALICDMAETYHVLNWRALPLSLAATLAAGLRNDSRSSLALIGQTIPFRDQMLAGILDRLAWLAWTKTKNAQHGKGAPEPILPKLLKIGKKDERKVAGFATPEDFDTARLRLMARAEGGR